MFVKKILKFSLTLALFSSLSFAENFVVLKDEFSTKNSLIEIFSYKCIHCYNHHKFATLSKLKQKLPNLRYELYPISLADKNYGTRLNELFVFARAKDAEQGKDSADEGSLVHKLADYFFTLYFVKRQEIGSLVELEQIATSVLSVSKDELKVFLESTEAKEILAEFEKANQIAASYGTPAFIVNAKYQIKPEAVDSLQNLQKIVEELSRK